MSHQSARFEQFFAAPREAVFDWFAQHANVSGLFGGRLVSERPAPDGSPSGTGSERVVGLGALRLHETVTRFERPDVIEYRVTRGWPIVEHQGRICFEAVEGGTRVIYGIDFRVSLPGLGSVVAGLLCASWRRNIHRAVDAVSASIPD